MALAYALKKVRKDTEALMVRLGLLSSHDMMGANYRTYGKEFGTLEFEDFIELAKRIYREAEANPGGFTIIELPRGRKAIDFQGKMRGVYDFDGDPIAFYKPDYVGLGYSTPQEELEDFKAGVRTAFA
jgi:hypothetical protein